MKKPLSTLLTERDLLESEDWIPCFEHELNGPISRVSVRNNHAQKLQTQFATLYHEVQDDSSFHYIRIYYTTAEDLDDEDDIRFEYKDIQLPGSTFVNSFSLQNDSIIFSRDPDTYEFHIITLPPNIIEEPHSTLERANSVNYRISNGRKVQEWSQPLSTEHSTVLFSRLYSPVNETYRVFSLNLQKTASTYFVNITILDNQTIIDDRNQQVTSWIQREKGEADYPVYVEETIDYNGFTDISNYQHTQHQMQYQQQHLQHQKQNMPQLIATMNAYESTIAFPYIKNKFITLDYTDRIDILSKIKSEKDRLYQSTVAVAAATGVSDSNGSETDGSLTKLITLPEYYYWQSYETVDAEIKGMELNKVGDTLALWTEFNYVYIYTRGLPEQEEQKNRMVLNGKNKEHESWWSKIEKWIDVLLSDTPEDEKELRDTYFPEPWKMIMAIPPVKDEYGGSKAVGAVGFYEEVSDAEDDTRYLFVALKNGNVNSYRIDEHEPHKSADLWSFAAERWDMLFAMCAVIFIFIYNESQRP
ncbi:hypothetical protein BDF20DRAFT_865145 [Mycotypha africana]|uniref:uncharacterized protein n=1 Tax=Mycotypha africana TaxID=64632 RepID=UPI002300FB4E|nr:uncharacterized protein BDF20DRAFT_865145 [Mycotypha africana]KAI8982139.1 hypothetical protein BDF20DRAFT_865145 [Mycotypha africana]